MQLRIEAFNVTNHANFGLPVNDLVSPNFGRIVEAGSPRVFQAVLKIMCYSIGTSHRSFIGVRCMPMTTALSAVSSFTLAAK